MSDDTKFAGMTIVFDPSLPPNRIELVPMDAAKARNRIIAKIGALQLAGHRVSLTGDIPGLFRIDDGPEITTNQLLGWPL